MSRKEKIKYVLDSGLNCPELIIRNMSDADLDKAVFIAKDRISSSLEDAYAEV